MDHTSWITRATFFEIAIYVWIFENGVELAVLEKPGGLPLRRAGAESPGAWLPAGTKEGVGGGGGRLYPLGGGEGHRERLFCSVKVLIFFSRIVFSRSITACSLLPLFSLQDSLGQTCPAGLGAESQPVRHKQGG